MFYYDHNHNLISRKWAESSQPFFFFLLNYIIDMFGQRKTQAAALSVAAAALQEE